MQDLAAARRKRTQAKKVKERARIMQAARSLFFKNGYAGTTMDAIADALGVKKPFIYWYFDNKEEIFAELCIRSAQAAPSTLVTSEESDDILYALYESCRRISLVQILDHETSAVTFREPNALSSASRQRMNKASREYSRGLSSMLLEAERKKLVSFRNARLTSLAMGGIVTALHRWYHPSGKLAPQELAHEIACIMLGCAGGSVQDDLKPHRAPKRYLDLDDEPWAVKYTWLTADVK